MEYAILLQDENGIWGWYMNGYLVALKVSPEEDSIFRRGILPVDGPFGILGTNVDRNQFNPLLWAQFTWWIERKLIEYKVRYALFNNSITGY